jgi:ABC-2 type transport system ATP-binding protein
MSIINLSSLTKIYDNFTAINDVSIQIESGEILGLIRHNGQVRPQLKNDGRAAGSTSGIVELWVRICLKYLRGKAAIGYLPEESPLYEI